jgi:hypothetical protein
VCRLIYFFISDITWWAIYIIGVFVEADPNRETASPPLDPFVNITPYGVIVPSVSIKCPVILG